MLPEYFCWTRFGTEAGEPIEAILARKEQERIANGGIFLWGIGNALGPSIQELIKLSETPQLVFSPIRSKPRTEDMDRSKTLEWCSAVDINGQSYTIPAGSKVTSRNTTRHYALVCRAEGPLRLDDKGETFGIRSVGNILSGKRLGGSQVTSVVKRFNEATITGTQYQASMIVTLSFPFFVILGNPVEI